MTSTGRPAVVGDLMAVDPIVIQANASLSDAAALLDHGKVVDFGDPDEVAKSYLDLNFSTAVTG